MAITVTIQPSDTQSLDTYIDSNAPTTNYETATTVTLGNNYDTGRRIIYLITFDLKLWFNPKTKFIDWAILETNQSATAGSQDGIYQCRPIKESWIDTQATYTVKTTGVNWTDLPSGWFARGIYPDAVDGTSVGRMISLGGITAYTVNGWKSWKFPASYIEQILKGTMFGFAISKPEGLDGRTITLDMGHNATPANRPKLTVTYEPYHKIYMVKSSLGQVK